MLSRDVFISPKLCSLLERGHITYLYVCTFRTNICSCIVGNVSRTLLNCFKKYIYELEEKMQCYDKPNHANLYGAAVGKVVTYVNKPFID